jgi:hypothetical protein
MGSRVVEVSVILLLRIARECECYEIAPETYGTLKFAPGSHTSAIFAEGWGIGI